MGRFADLLERPSDLRYAFDKGAVALLRGIVWQILHLRRPRPLFLGAGIKFVSAHNLRLGGDVSIGAHSYIETSARKLVVFGNRVTLRENAWVQCRSGLNAKGEGLEIGDNTYIGPNAVIGVGGKITIGQGCQIGAGVSFAAERHEFHDGAYTTGVVSRTGIAVGAGCWFGNNVTVLDGVEIGAGCVIGACSTVTRSIPAGSVAFGSPAKVMRSTQGGAPARGIEV